MPKGIVRTLVVDDEQSVRFFLENALQQIGYVTVAAASGEEALDRLREAPFDLIILDLMLGGRVDGIRVLESVKWRWPETIVIILTAHGSLDSALKAIREGVDGYLIKPVEPEELWQAVQEALDRHQRLARSEREATEEDVLHTGPFALDVKKQMVTLHGQLLSLTASEYNLLSHLMENAYRAISPQELVRVVRQRQKVEPDPSNPAYILTVRGVGYRFVG
jgi:DNA-binding response OmpR family regulator